MKAQWFLPFLVLAAPVFSQDFQKEKLKQWHHWRGPLANGTVPNGNPPLKWDQKTNIKWKTAIPGEGTSTPIIWNDKIFVLSVADTKKQAKAGDIPRPDPRFRKLTTAPTTYHQYQVHCLNRANGKTLWTKIACEAVPHEGHHRTHTYAGFSPTTDGKYLYVSFGSRGVYCYDFNGNLQWKRDLGVQQTRRGWGEAIAPVIYKDCLIHAWDHEGDSALYVLDAKTGKDKWAARRDEPTNWSTPLVIDHNGTTQVIVNATNRVRSYDLKTGKVLWSCGGLSVNAIPSPVAKNGVVYCMSGYRGHAAFALPLDAKGDVTGTEKILWKLDRGTPYVPSPLLYKDRLYFTQSNSALLTSVDLKTGKEKISRARLPEIRSCYGSPIGINDRIYITGRNGTTVVLDHADKLKVLTINALDDPIDASPVVVGSQLFLRGEKYLYCIEKK